MSAGLKHFPYCHLPPPSFFPLGSIFQKVMSIGLKPFTPPAPTPPLLLNFNVQSPCRISVKVLYTTQSITTPGSLPLRFVFLIFRIWLEHLVTVCWHCQNHFLSVYSSSRGNCNRLQSEIKSFIILNKIFNFKSEIHHGIKL